MLPKNKPSTRTLITKQPFQTLLKGLFCFKDKIVKNVNVLSRHFLLKFSGHYQKKGHFHPFNAVFQHIRSEDKMSGKPLPPVKYSLDSVANIPASPAPAITIRA